MNKPKPISPIPSTEEAKTTEQIIKNYCLCLPITTKQNIKILIQKIEGLEAENAKWKQQQKEDYQTYLDKVSELEGQLEEAQQENKKIYARIRTIEKENLQLNATLRTVNKTLNEYPEKLDLTKTEHMLVKRLRDAANPTSPNRNMTQGTINNPDGSSWQPEKEVKST